jgi:hypothetical protein
MRINSSLEPTGFAGGSAPKSLYGRRLRMNRRAWYRVLLTGWAGAILGLAGLSAVSAYAGRNGSEIIPRASIFLKSDASDEDRARIRSALTALPRTRSVTYHSKGDAFAEFKALYRDQPELWRTLSVDDLPERFDVTVVAAGDLAAVRSAIGAHAGVEEVASDEGTSGPRRGAITFRKARDAWAWSTLPLLGLASLGSVAWTWGRRSS